MEEFKRLEKIHPQNYHFTWIDRRSINDTKALESISNYLQNPTQTIQLVQFHGNHSVFSEIRQTHLRRWRDLASGNKVPFFTFAVVRKPF